jgi:hypothetical protein
MFETGDQCQEKSRLRDEFIQTMEGFNSTIRDWLAGKQGSRQALVVQQDEFRSAWDRYRKHIDRHGCRYERAASNGRTLQEAPVRQTGYSRHASTRGRVAPHSTRAGVGCVLR